MRSHQQRTLRRWGVRPPLAGAACVFLFLYSSIACADLPWLGPGPNRPASCLVVGVAYFAWIVQYGHNLAHDLPRLFRWVAHSLWVLPLSSLGGRFLASGLGLCLWNSDLGAFLGLGAGVGLMRLLRELPEFPQSQYVRGTWLHDGAVDSGVPATGAGAAADDTIRWAGQRLRRASAWGNFLVVGAIGSGKTLMQRELLGSVLGFTRRVVVFDVKRDVVSHLHAMGVAEGHALILNPFDARAVAWDVSRDLTDPAKAYAYAKSIIPDRPGELQPFFTSAAQALLSGVLAALMINAPRAWTLRDVVLIVCDAALLRRVLRSTTQTQGLVDQFFAASEALGNFLSNLANATVPLRTVAAIWERTPDGRRVSLSEWADRGDSVLVMGASFDEREAVAAMNRIAFNFLTDRLLSGAERPGEHRTWFFIDELKEAKRLDALPRLLTNGRSKGVRVVLGLQDREGLRSTYGDREADEILGMCHNQSFLKTNSSQTAQWASEQLGSVELTEWPTSGPTPEQRREEDPDKLPRGEHRSTKPVALPSEIMGLPTAKDGVVEGYHVIPDHPDGHRVRRSSARYAFHTDAAGADFHPRPPDERFLLCPWSDDDARRLGLAGEGDGPAGRKKPRTPPAPPSGARAKPPREPARASGSPLDEVKRVRLGPRD